MHENKNGLDQEPTSLVNVRRSDVFPKKMLVSEDTNLRIPFPLLNGEAAEFIGRTADGIIVMSNFRLLLRYKETFINVALGLVETVEMRDIFFLHIYCKDATVIRCAFQTNETCQDWFKRLCLRTAPCCKNSDVFAFAFHAWCVDQGISSDSTTEEGYQFSPLDKSNPYSFTRELVRLKFDLGKAWRYTEINKSFELCSSYPSEHIVPKSVSDENLAKVAGFRALRRFPSVVWRNCRNGAVLVRSSQPEMGFFGWRNTDDENLLSAIPQACALNPGVKNKHTPREDSSGSDLSSDDSSVVENGMDGLTEPKKMLIIDCRSYGAAFANRAKGGGVECPEYYQSCEIQFMNLANIHSIRKSFLALRTLCSSGVDQACWLSGLENTKWLHNMASLLKAAILVVSANEKEGRPVLVHCSDGWDRTAQIISLAELMLDPFYRTVEGFQVLVEREWLHFGHKFADRCGNGEHDEDVNERCPVFLQWLECVYQLHSQFPCQFQFNEAFLVKMVQHTYSCLFGTFLCNTARERLAESLDQHTVSLWSLLKDKAFINHLYEPSADHEVLYPASHVQNLRLWSSIYLSNNSSFAGPEENNIQQVLVADPLEPGCLQKTRSCENLCMNELNSSLSRRKSDPNIATEHCEQQTQKLLKDAMGGDTSCSSSESVKSSENNASMSESPTINANGFDNSLNDGEELSENAENSQAVGLLSEEPSLNGVCTEGERNGGNIDEKGVGVEEKCENGFLRETNGNGIVSNTETLPLSNGIGDHNKVEKPTENFVNSNGAIMSEEIIREIPNGDSACRVNGHSISGKNNCVNNRDKRHDSENSIETISDSDDTSTGDGGEGSFESSTSPYENGIENGHNSLYHQKQPSASSSSSTINGASISMKLRQKNLIPNSDRYEVSLESSTDTVTGEQSSSESSSHTLVPTIREDRDMGQVAPLKALCDRVQNKQSLKTGDSRNSISTSTSDLTDSRVGEKGNMGNLSHERLLNVDESVRANLKLQCFWGQNSLCNGTNGTCRGVTVDTSMTPSVYHTPISPQSRTSTCPPTPGTCDSKSLESRIPRHQSGLGRHLDADGLTKFKDPAQKQIAIIKARYEQQLATCEQKISLLSERVRQLSQHMSPCNGDGLCSLDINGIGNESPGSCDMQSMHSNHSNAASDASWDQMDDPEVQLTRWVPDHTVTQCASCESEFGMIRRKHHCRNCGLIFCHACCKETMPLPHQMIHTQERVCQACYNKVTMLLSKSIIEMENGIGEYSTVTAASN